MYCISYQFWEAAIKMIVYSSSSSSSYSSSSSSYSSSPPASSAASSSPSGVSGSPSFLPGQTPHHLGSLALGLLFHSPSFSFQTASSHSDLMISAPPSYNFFLSPYVLVSVLRSYLENMCILGGCAPQKASGSSPFLMALFLICPC